MILSCQNLSKSFGSDDIIKNVSFQINEGDKVAIVGNNGAGKSTLLKMITGELDTDAGTVVFAKDTTIGYLAQYQNMEGNETVYQTVYSSRTDILEMQKNLQKMEEQMTKLTDDALDALLVRYHETRIHRHLLRIQSFKYISYHLSNLLDFDFDFPYSVSR